MTFDYKLRDGVITHSNALELMRMIGSRRMGSRCCWRDRRGRSRRRTALASAMLEQEGWAAIKAGSLPGRRRCVSRSDQLDPKNASLRVGAGMAAALQRRDAEAKAHLEQALDLDPKLTVARAQLAQVVRRQGDYQEAIRLLRDCRRRRAGRQRAVRELLERWKRERDLHERMRLEVGDFFTVSFEGPKTRRWRRRRSSR